MKTLFLDIDGVLNGHELKANNYCGIEAPLVSNFNDIMLDVPDLQIVISSAWRYMIICGDMTVRGFEHMLLTHGVMCYGRIKGITVSDEIIPNRRDQIYDYAKRHGIVDFVAVDDLQLNMPELVKTNPRFGLSKDDSQEIIRRFNHVTGVIST